MILTQTPMSPQYLFLALVPMQVVQSRHDPHPASPSVHEGPCRTSLLPPMAHRTPPKECPEAWKRGGMDLPPLAWWDICTERAARPRADGLPSPHFHASGCSFWRHSTMITAAPLWSAGQASGQCCSFPNAR